MNVASILKGKKVHPEVSLGISFGSKQVLRMLSENGALATLIESGARILESTCGPCIGMGQSPCSNAVSLRTFNRNFHGRSGTLSAGVYLVSPETAAISAVNGYLSSAKDVDYVKSQIPEKYLVDDSMLIKSDGINKDVYYGPNIKPYPVNVPLMDSFKKKVTIKVEDNITTDHIMPAGAKVLPYRSNIEKISEFCFGQIDQDFPKRTKENKGGVIIAGENYGQGSSREHAALAPMYLGIKVVIAKSYARIHRQNLINAGIVPLLFINTEDYDSINLLDEIEFINLLAIEPEKNICIKVNGKTFEVKNDLTEKEIKILKNGGLLNTIKKELEK